jgi:beta-galactosidase
MVGTDGVTPSVGGQEYSQFISEIKTLRKQYSDKAQNPSAYEKRRTGILFNLDNLWNEDQQKQTNQWSFFEHTLKYYKAAKSFFAPVDFIDESADFSKYKVLIAPAYWKNMPKMVVIWFLLVVPDKKIATDNYGKVLILNLLST